MYNLSFHDRQHIQKMLANEQVVAGIFDEFILSVSPQLKKWANTGKINLWIGNAGVEKFVESKLVKLHSDLSGVINNFQIDAWKRANLKDDEFVKQYIEDMAISEAVKHGLFSQNLDVLKQFQQRKENGMNLSQKVWNLAGQTKTQLEFYLESGLSVGRSAATISQDVRQILNNPDKKFHRIRDEKGNLVLSQPMKDYHPGIGQYRSSAMNAKRLAVTETNMMYRKADSARWAELDFVLGFEVNRSGNHNGLCKICDALAGKYPKGFVFTGWHPFCICVATPILMGHEDFATFLHNDSIPQGQVITDIPKTAKDFVSENKDRLHSALWYKDNFDNKGGYLRTIKVKSLPIKKEHIKTDEEKVDIQRRWLHRKISNMEREIRMNKKLETGVVFDSKGNILVDKRGKAYNVSFTEDECKRMKDCIMTHNHPRGWGYPENSLGRIGNSFSPEDIYLAVNWNLAEMRAVTPNFTFIMKRPEQGWNIAMKELQTIVRNENEKLRIEFGKRIDEGTLTVTQANAVHYHILWKRISEKCGWSYSKAKTR